MDERDDWPTWGRLIDDARDALRPEVSQNEAARQLGMSGTNWRRIIQGISGAMASARGIKTLARMAQLVGVTPQQLEAVGRADVAEELRLIDMERERSQGPVDRELQLLGEIRERIEELQRLRDERRPADSTDHDEAAGA